MQTVSGVNLQRTCLRNGMLLRVYPMATRVSSLCVGSILAQCRYSSTGGSQSMRGQGNSQTIINSDKTIINNLTKEQIREENHEKKATTPNDRWNWPFDSKTTASIVTFSIGLVAVLYCEFRQGGKFCETCYRALEGKIKELFGHQDPLKQPEQEPKPLTAKPAPDPTQSLGILASSVVFGESDWKTYFKGDVGFVPPLPANIDEILNEPCPIWRGKKIRETHVLTLLPQTVEGELLTVDHLHKLRSEYKLAPVRYSEAPALSGPSVSKSYWFLMTKDVLPDTRGKKYDVQLSELRRYRDYRVPTILEATAVVVTQYAKTKKGIYPTDTFTRCQEQILNFEKKIGAAIIGGFTPDVRVINGRPEPSGFHVSGDNNDAQRENTGLAAVRRL